MSNLSIVQYIKQDAVTKRLNELLGKRAPQFVTSLVSVANQNQLLAKCKPETVMSAALVAASMDLPINQNLGFAYIIPYKDAAQFQMGYKGFIQLAQRSGYYKTINVTDVREGEIVKFDRLTGEIEYEWINNQKEREQAKLSGFVAYFKLLNGFEKSLYMTIDELEGHGKKYSKTFQYGKGLWADNFEAMASKTVLKLLISKYGPLNTQLAEAIQKDQTVDEEYLDNPNKVEVVDAELGESEEDAKEAK